MECTNNQIINDKENNKYYWVYDNNYEYLPGKKNLKISKNSFFK